MTASFVVYVDESGDEGFRFSRGSSQWLVLSAVTIWKSMDIQTVKLVDNVRSILRKPPGKALHFRNLKHQQRLPYCQEIAQARLRAVSVLVHKPSITEPERFREKYRLYFYAVRYLLERVSWLCRDALKKNEKHAQLGDGTAEIEFSNRSSMSYEKLREYLKRLEDLSKYRDIRIDWSVIKDGQVRPFPHALRRGLQIADAVASSFYFGLEKSASGFTEGRYAQMLKPVVYRREGQFWGYGVKVWPGETEAAIEFDDSHAWMRSYK